MPLSSEDPGVGGSVKVVATSLGILIEGIDPCVAANSAPGPPTAAATTPPAAGTVRNLRRELCASGPVLVTSCDFTRSSIYLSLLSVSVVCNCGFIASGQR